MGTLYNLLTLERLSQQTPDHHTLEALPMWQSSECSQGLPSILWHALLRHLLASYLLRAHQVQLA